jgi:hypothetical protein
MGILFGTASWARHLSRNNKEEELKIAGYLDQIAEEALALSRIWEGVALSILNSGAANADSNTIWIRLVERPEWTIYSKSIPKSRLEIFYEKVSSVLGKAQKGETDFLICKIGAILQKRQLTRDIIEEELKRIKDARLFNKENQIKDDVSIQESIALLKSEVSALTGFAREFRTKI